MGHKELFSCRAPGNACLSGLKSMQESGSVANNDSWGCGGVMRVAPVGMYYATLMRNNAHGQEKAMGDGFELGWQTAAITHGHPTAQLAAGTLAAIVMQLLMGEQLPQAINAVLHPLQTRPGHEETLHAMQRACQLVAQAPNSASTSASLGEGWATDEALAIAVYCALSAKDFRSGVALAVNHSGDSDSTGSIAGQLLGAMHGVGAIPASLIVPLELREVIAEMADDLATLNEWNLNDDTPTDELDFYFERYPGG